MLLLSTATGMVAGYAGLLASYHSGVPTGPSIIVAAGVFYLFSLAFGAEGGFARRLIPARHLEA